MKINITKETVKEYFFIVFGAIIMCLAIAMLVDIFVVPGGASGLSIAFYYVFDGTLPVGVLKWIINIPLFIWGLLVLGRQFGFRTFYGFTMSSIFIDFFRGSFPGLEFIRIQDTEFVKNLAQNDFFFFVLIASVLMGLGLGIIFKFKGTTGGSDIPAAIFQKKYGIPPGKGIILVDFFVITLTGFIFYLKGIPLDKPIIVLILYSLFQLFASSYVIDIIIDGFDYARMALIVTDKSNEIASEISSKLSRGATAIKARGIYRNIDREIVMTVVTLKEVTVLNEIIKEVDPDAFMISNTVHEVTGYGFRRRL
jgi:uncharacterized membrane-anchored protein YitT (DUF2179 family)